MLNRSEKDRTTWFSMWFLGAIATFGAAFFPMFYRLIDSRNKHFNGEAKLEKKINQWLVKQGKEAQLISCYSVMNAKAWAASIILIIPAFIITYYLSRDLMMHEQHQNRFLENAFPKRLFMPQTIPIRRYVLITVVTLGVGGVYWLYRVTNLYNAHFKAQLVVEREIARLMEEK